jgi:tetratricopeptide (TPR) repeat protein
VERLRAALGLSSRQREVRAERLYQEGQRLYSQGRFQEAIQQYQRAEGLYEGLATPERLAWVAEGLGTAYYGTERYSNALAVSSRARCRRPAFSTLWA